MDLLEKTAKEEYGYILLMAIGIMIYVCFVWYVYQHLSRRDIIKLNLDKYRFAKHWRRMLMIKETFLFLLQYIVLFPVYVFLLFAVLTLSLIFLSPNPQVQTIFLSSAMLVCVIRLLAYIKEDISREVAKLLPLVLLANVLIDPTFLSQETFLGNLPEAYEAAYSLGVYLVFIVLLEWPLRFVYQLKVLAWGSEETFTVEVSKEDLEKAGAEEKKLKRILKKKIED